MKVYHWWPGRTWAGPCPIPSIFIKEAERMGTRYLTFALDYHGNIPVCGVARCCPKDVPSRKLGREIAIGRMQSVLHDFENAVSRP